METKTHSESGWPVAMVFGIMAAFILGLSHTGQQLRAEIAETISGHGPTAPARPTRPEVLLLSGNQADQARVAGTVNPRGYQVLAAATAEACEELLRAHAARIGVIVVDSEWSAAARVAGMADTLAPGVKIVKLPPQHTASDLAVLLLGAI